jgi:protein-disulfide isomerase
MPPVPKPKSKSKAPSGKKGPSRNLVIAIAAAAVVAVALIVGSIVLTGGGDGGSSSTTTSTGGSSSAPVALFAGIPQDGTVLGDPNAPTVKMMIYEDIQCPFCKKFQDDALPGIVDEYVKTNKVKLDWRGMAFVGPDSQKALRISLAAGLQNKLWEVVGLFYENQGQENSGWVSDGLVDEILAQVPGLDAAKVKQDASSPAVTKQVAAIQAEAEANSISATPSFLIASGANEPYQIQVATLTTESFRPALDDAIAG